MLKCSLPNKLTHEQPIDWCAKFLENISILSELIHMHAHANTTQPFWCFPTWVSSTVSVGFLEDLSLAVLVASNLEMMKEVLLLPLVDLMA